MEGPAGQWGVEHDPRMYIIVNHSNEKTSLHWIQCIILLYGLSHFSAIIGAILLGIYILEQTWNWLTTFSAYHQYIFTKYISARMEPVSGKHLHVADVITLICLPEARVDFIHEHIVTRPLQVNYYIDSNPPDRLSAICNSFVPIGIDCVTPVLIVNSCRT